MNTSLFMILSDSSGFHNTLFRLELGEVAVKMEEEEQDHGDDGEHDQRDPGEHELHSGGHTRRLGQPLEIQRAIEAGAGEDPAEHGGAETHADLLGGGNRESGSFTAFQGIQGGF